MKHAILFIFALLFAVNINAQEQEKSRKELRAERKQKELQKQQENRVLQEQWVDQKTFVLEATQVFGKKGSIFSISPTTNFVLVNQEEATIQLSFNGLVGWNGVGGITVKGRITKYEVEKDNKNKPIFIRMSIQGSGGFQDISIWISSNGNGEAQVTDIRGNRIRFTGQIVNLLESRVYEGTTRF